MAAGTWIDLIGTLFDSFGLGLTGVRLQSALGRLRIRNNDDTADAGLTASTVHLSGDSLVLNSDAANTGADYSLTLMRPTTGMNNSWTLTFPANDGSPGQTLTTDGNGRTTWAFGAGGTVADYERTFTDADLSIAGLLVVNHDLSTQPSAIGIWDRTGELIWPDTVEVVNENQVIVGLASFQPIIGTWKLSIGA